MQDTGLVSKSKVCSILVLIFTLALSQFGCSQSSTNSLTQSASGPVILTVTDGTAVKTFSIGQIKALPSISGTAATINGAGSISTPAQCKGIALTQILSSFKSFSPSATVRISGSDSYFVNLTYDQVESGNFTTYSFADGTPVSTPGKSTVFLEYEENGAALGSDLGPLRLGIISPQGQVTRSSLWVKWVDNIQIIPAQ